MSKMCDSQAATLADIVAVHGLASNLKTTWESRKHSEDTCNHARQNKRPPDAPITKPMWLGDFLPEQGLDARIMAFNHNSAWETNALSKQQRRKAGPLSSSVTVLGVLSLTKH
ncbi:hypothetical protein GJ744_003788 [Endocarpon pusillum]|uniref:Uncharacterized protein n=1 Tax=Endocarpon pusillum TaxID=364733 RepID=A0A8H7AV01_9EURO|nr:hypothetical protein GJ744_003788 [Endocarpon pusillum]